MRIEIDTGSRLDQSGDTTFSFSNNIQMTILLRQTVRDTCLGRLKGRKLKKELRLFAVCIYLLIKDHLSELQEVRIDREYPGHEEEIKWILLNMMKSHPPHPGQLNIEFVSLGKGSSAHKIAWRTFRKELKPNKILTAQEVLSALLK